MRELDHSEAQVQSWRRHLSFEPEEARMLGLEAAGRKSLVRLGEQTDLYREYVAAPAQQVGPALRRRAQLAVHRFDRGDEHCELERIMFACRAGVEDVDGYLREHVSLLREGLARGRAPALELIEYFRARELPELLAGAEADSAWPELDALLRDELLPAARELGPDRWRIGAQEYAWRLDNMSVGHSPEELLEQARALLREQQSKVAKLLGLPNFEAALPHLRELKSARLAPGEVAPAYRDAARRSVDFVREQGLFSLPEGFELSLDIISPGPAKVMHARNNPAPLFGTGSGSFAVLDDPSRHRQASLVPMVVHEGIPGHYLQSWLWQRRFRSAGGAPSFISISDVFASERQDWGGILALEGWAVYSEDLMLEAGFHPPEQAAIVASYHAVRCVRAWIDIGLHTLGMSLERAAQLFVEEAGLERADAQRELMRSMRVPNQPLCYFAGWRAIAALVRESGLPLAEAHERLLACGPSLPNSLLGARHE